MADKRRFDLFAQLLRVEFPSALRVFDVAGGQGRLNQALTLLGCEVLTFDRRHKHLPVPFAERVFTLEEPAGCDLVVGMHPDGATRVIVEYAAQHQVPFAVVPCCSDNSMPYRPWMRHLTELAQGLGLHTKEVTMPMEGRARVLLGAPRPFPGTAVTID